MSTLSLRERYLNIAKYSLSFLKEKGFRKAGSEYSRENNELILEISSSIPRPKINSETLFEGQICWEIRTTNKNFLDVYMFMEAQTNLAVAPVVYSNIISTHFDRGIFYLTDKDSQDSDQQLIDRFRAGIELDLLPLLDTVSSLDDLIRIAEKEIKAERETRLFFRDTNLEYKLSLMYASKNLKDKTLETNEELMKTAFSKKFALTNKDKYLKYFNFKQ